MKKVSNTIEVTVIIPTYRDWDRLNLCLDALSRQSYPASRFEIIVVNNDPSNKQPNHFVLPENCILIEEDKPGSYAARNAAIRVSQGSILAFTDSDCIPQKNWIESAMDFFSKNPKCDRIGGQVKLILDENKVTWSDIYEKVFAFRQKEFVNNMGMAATANMLSRRKVFEDVGLFSDSLMSGGDAEWGIRALRQNFTIQYVEDVIVWHPSRSDFKEIVQKAKREAGGHFTLEKQSGTILAKILLGFVPPLKSMVYVLRNDKLTIKEKIVSIILRYYLRLISAVEKIKILFFGKQVERV